MIIDISEDGRTIEWWSNGERKIATIYQLIDAYDEIVRCKDCKWMWKHVEADTHKVNLTMYRCTKGHNPDTENFYCSRGERKESEE